MMPLVLYAYDLSPSLFKISELSDSFEWSRDKPIVHDSRSQDDILLEASVTNPGLICAVLRMIVAQSARDESDREDGPFRLLGESIELIDWMTTE